MALPILSEASAAVLALLVACNVAVAAPTPIKHVVFIMQENRSFDSYFGTFPGADGIPAGVCLQIDMKNPKFGCAAPFHDVHDQNAGGPHFAIAAQSDLDNGIMASLMDGFASVQFAAVDRKCRPNDPSCGGLREGILRHDAMGYHTAEELPNYWAYAQHFVLQDHLFESERSWSLPSHLGMVSEWVASCPNPARAATCITAADLPSPRANTHYPWANLFQLMDIVGVSWKYYLTEGAEPDCNDGEMTCPPQIQLSGVPSIWNPPPAFAWVHNQGKAYIAEHNPVSEQFLADLKAGSLPQVSWIVPSDQYSEHPPNGITAGMEYITSIVNAIMQSPDWKSTIIFIAWDDWGGFYDHVIPPNVDRNGSRTPIQGYGLRVPGLAISAYARPGMIDHAVLSFDAYATFIEDLFMNKRRLIPASLGNPDHRPTIRDEIRSVTFPNGTTSPVGDLMNEFDFAQSPAPPLILPTHIPTGIHIACRVAANDNNSRCTTPRVTIAWSPVTGPSVPGPFIYHVTRDGAELPQCAGAATSCVDLPGRGVHFYRTYSVNAQRVASPQSAAAEADEM